MSAGRTCAATSSMPSRRATESATAWLSPVIIATRMPIAWRRVDRLGRLGPDLVLDRERADDARRRRRRAGRSGPRAPSVGRRRGSRARGRGPRAGAARRPRRSRPSTVARAPRPASASKSVAVAGCDARAARAARRSPGPAGAPSRPRPTRRAGAARPRRRRRPRRPRATGSPLVRVPVLSKMTDVELARPLERDPVLDEQAVPRAERGARSRSRAGWRGRARAGRRSRGPSPCGRGRPRGRPRSHQNTRVTAPAASAT